MNKGLGHGRIISSYAEVRELFALPAEAANDDGAEIEAETTPYGRDALKNECEALGRAKSGRNNRLNYAAFRMGQLSGGGALNPDEATTALLEAMRANGYLSEHTLASAEATIRSGFAEGLKKPRSAPTEQLDRAGLAEVPTVRLDNLGALTDRTMLAIRAQFEQWNHDPSEPHFDGLEHIAKTIEGMADKVLEPKFFVSFLPPGMGKTTTLVEATRELNAMDIYKDEGVIVFLSRKEEIRKLAKLMGLADTDYAVIVGKGAEENLLGNSDKTEAKVLFTTQKGLETRSHNDQKFADMKALYYRGKPRSVRVWDEACLPSITLSLGRYDLSDLFRTLQDEKKLELLKEIEQFFGLFGGFKDGDTVTCPDVEKYGIAVEEAQAWFKDSDLLQREAIEVLWGLSGRTVRVRDDKLYYSVLDYNEALPSDLAPMLILDASGQQRNTYRLWKEHRGGLEFLPSPQKTYRGFTIHHWDKGAGKSAHYRKGTDWQPLVEGIARTINREIPQGEDVLVIHFRKSKNIPDMEAEINAKLTGNTKRVHFCNWGRHTATNDYEHVKYVILAGVLQYRVSENEATRRGARKAKVEEPLNETEYQQTRLGEIAHNLLQAACRGHVRHSVGDGCPPGCHLYVIFSTAKGTGIPQALLPRIFPAATVVDWRPATILRGKKLAIAEFVLKAANDNIARHDIISRAGIKHQSEYSSLVNDKGLKAYLAEQGVEIEAQYGGGLRVRRAATKVPTTGSVHTTRIGSL